MARGLVHLVNAFLDTQVCVWTTQGDAHRFFPLIEIAAKLQNETGVFIHNGDFLEIAKVCCLEAWTRDPFDRLIVSHAQMHGMSYLISSDEKIKQNYQRTIW